MDESFLEDFKPKRSNKNKKKIKSIRLKPLPFILFILLFSSIIIINLENILNWEKDNQEIKKIETNIEEEIEIEIIEEEEGEIINPPKVKESDYWLYIKVPFQNVDLSALKEKNNDTVGFINVKNTNINYPIVQTTNNDYYLNHAYDKSYNEAGWVFMDYRNNNFNDFNTIIYGHGRLNKTVFGSLKDLLKDSWQSNKDNYTLTISSLTMNYVYQIFSIYTIDAESYYIKTEFDNNEEKQDWITEMNNRNTSIIYSPANINDKIITLSTCLNNDNRRIVVHAKLIKQQTKETID